MHYNLIYFFALVVLTSGLFIILVSNNYIKKIIGLGIFQNSVLIFYIALSKPRNGVVPIDLNNSSVLFTSPLPHVLMLTAIVVGFATLSVGLAMIYQIYNHYGTINSYKIDSEIINQ